jgi:hypothetical protein
MDPRKVTVRTIAEWINVSPARLRSIANRSHTLYKPPRTIVIRGKSRTLSVPNDTLKPILKRLHKLLRKLPVHGRAHGGVRRRSCFTSADYHCGKHVIVTRDVQDCFPSITRSMLRTGLLAYGLKSDVATILSRLCCLPSCLPQGAHTSSDVLNFNFYELDQVLASIAGKLGADYSRVYDDIVVSCTPQSAHGLGRRIESELSARGFRISVKKRKRLGYQDRRAAQFVHGLDVSNRGGPRISRTQSRKARQLVDDLVRGAKRSTPQALPALAHKRQRVVGYSNHFRQATQSPARWIDNQVIHVDRLICSMLGRYGLVPSNNRNWWSESIDQYGRPLYSEPQRLAQLHRNRQSALQLANQQPAAAQKQAS